MDDGHLLELERRLEGRGRRVAAADDENVLGIDQLVREPLHSGRGRLHGSVDVAGGAAQRIPHGRGSLIAEQLAQHQLGGGERGHERLGHDRDLARSSGRHHGVVCGVGQRAAGDVDYADSGHPATQLLEGDDHVAELAGGGYAYHGVALAQGRQVVAEFARPQRDDRRVAGGGDAAVGRRGRQRGVVGRAVAYDVDAPRAGRAQGPGGRSGGRAAVLEGGPDGRALGCDLDGDDAFDHGLAALRCDLVSGRR